MKPVLKRLGRIASIAALGAALLAAALYALRWPLLGGIARAKLDGLAGELLEADLADVRLEGSLLWGLEARDLVLRPRPGSPLGEATARRARVEYGFLGQAPPRVRLEGVRLAFRDRGGPAAPPHEIARDALEILGSLRLDGRAEARDARVVLADGRELAVDQVSLEGACWSARFRDPLFGEVEASAETTPSGALAILARAASGPVRFASLSLAPGRGDRPFAFEAGTADRALRGSGRLSYEGDRLRSASGELSLAEGRASATLDFDTGRATLEADAVLPLPDPFRGEAAVTLQGAGPAAGPLDRWEIGKSTARATGLLVETLRFDDARVEAGPGTLAALPFRLRARRGADRLDAEGVARWQDGLSLRGKAEATAADVAPYLALLEDAPPLRASGARARGDVALDADGRFSFDGAIDGQAGGAAGFDWGEFRVEGSLAAPGAIEVRDARIRGSPFAPEARLRGRLEGDGFSAIVTAGEDRAEIEGRLRDGDLASARFRLDGPLAWLGAGGPWSVTGTFSGNAVEADVESAAGAGGRIALAFRTEAGVTTVDVSPGALHLPDDRLVRHDALRIRVAQDEVTVDGLRARLSDPPAEVAGGLKLAFPETGTRITLSLPEVRAFDAALGPLAAAATRNGEGWAIEATLGPEAGDRLRVSGSAGERLDLQVEARVPDLRRWLADVEGRATLEARVQGTLDAPVLKGRLDLERVTTLGLPPLAFPISLESDGRRLRVRGLADPSPFGRIDLEGEVDLGGSQRLDLRLDVDSKDLAFVADRMSEATRPWLPPARGRARAVLTGTISQPSWSVELEASAPRWQPPAPLGAVDGLRVSASLDASGLDLRSVEGTLGLGAFRARGRWDLFAPKRPLSLKLAGRNLLALGTDLVRLRVNPEVELAWSEAAGARLSGRVEVPLFLFHREFGPPSASAADEGRELAPPRLLLSPAEEGGFFIPGLEGLTGLALDLEVVSAGDVRIENGVVAAILEGRGRLAGTAERPIVSGTLQVRRRKGEVKLGAGIFIRVDQAEAVLPADPGKSATVDFQGRSGIGDDAIQIRVFGPLSGPSLSLSSNPARPQKELLARLAFGQGPGAVSGTGAGGTAALRIFTELQEERPIAERKEGFFGRIKPTVVPGEVPGQRRVPWELPPAGTLRGTAIRTEYVYNSFLSVVAETNRAGDVAGDLKVRFRF